MTTDITDSAVDPTAAPPMADQTDRRADVGRDPDPFTGPDGAGEALRWLLLALSWGAAAVHLVMVPQHAQASMVMGLAFALAGWFQLVFGIVMVARPTRRWVQAGIAANTAFVAVWAWSRTVGLPDWTGAGGVEPVSTVDGFCVGLEVTLVGTAVVLLVAPNVLAHVRRPALGVVAGVSIGILVAATAVIASPDAANHLHGGDADHHDEASAATTADHDHAGAAEGPVAADPVAAGESGAHSHDATAADGADARHHGESDIAYDDLPPATKAEVDQVKAAWADRYPTGADAAAAGWFKATPNLYGIGAHYIRNVNGFSVAEPFDLMNPNILLYDGEGPDAKFAGVSYVVAGDVEGFTGSDDFWHAHESVCMKDGKISLTEEASAYWYSEAECSTNGGRVMPIAADRMMHLWIGPGYTDAPIFAHDNPEIFDGYYPKQPA